MLALVLSSRFRKDVKRAQKRGKDMAKLRDVLTVLARQEELSQDYRDHALHGNWRGFRDLHIEPDWLLLYRIADDEVQLARTGTHSDLFRDEPSMPWAGPPTSIVCALLTPPLKPDNLAEGIIDPVC